jgi:hypothetical protein
MSADSAGIIRGIKSAGNKKISQKKMEGGTIPDKTRWKIIDREFAN